jgi:hypothetical protein
MRGRSSTGRSGTDCYISQPGMANPMEIKMHNEINQVARDFATLLQRPSNYFSLSSGVQWEIDSALGALDIFIEATEMTAEMTAEWHAHFGELT